MKNKILKSITWIAVIIWFLGAMAADLESNVSIYMMLAAEAWIFPYVIINHRRYLL